MAQVTAWRVQAHEFYSWYSKKRCSNIRVEDLAQHLPGKCKVISPIPGTKSTNKQTNKMEMKYHSLHIYVAYVCVEENV